MSPNYNAYVERLREIRDQEDRERKRIAELKAIRKFFGRKKRQAEMEKCEIKLEYIRSQSAKYTAMLEDLREKEDEKSMIFWDEQEQPYNEVIGLCYGKVILCTDVGDLLYADYDPQDGVAVGDTLPDVGDLTPLDSLPRGEAVMILSYMIEAGETPLHYLDFLRGQLQSYGNTGKEEIS